MPKFLIINPYFWNYFRIRSNCQYAIFLLFKTINVKLSYFWFCRIYANFLFIFLLFVRFIGLHIMYNLEKIYNHLSNCMGYRELTKQIERQKTSINQIFIKRTDTNLPNKFGLLKIFGLSNQNQCNRNNKTN